MPPFAALTLDQVGNELLNLGFFASEGVEDSLNAVELERARRLIGKKWWLGDSWHV